MTEEEILKQKLDEAYKLLEQAIVYVEFHYMRSGVGFGKHSRDLMNKIKAVLGIR
jgi:hypothetical protein